MKKFWWILTGMGIAAAIAYLVNNSASGQYSYTNGDIDDAASSVSGWGTKQRIAGVGDSLAGTVKEGVGRVSGDAGLAGEGVLDQVAGAVEDTAGKAAQGVSDTIKELNR